MWWIEQLLDRSIERIQVYMKDRGCRFQLFLVHHGGQLTKDQQGAEPGQIASEYSGATDPAAGAAGDLCCPAQRLDVEEFRRAQ